MAVKHAAAKWRPIARNYTNRKRAQTRGIILHTTASAGATSMWGWFSNIAARASSHFHVDNAGNVEQYVDADKIAWTTGAASYTTIGIETQGDGSAAWTDAQLEALEDLLVWACRKYDIPARAMTSSKSSERGIGWHRLGIDGNFPATGILRGRNQRGVGGESWSSSRGKVCPGDKRIEQIPALVARVATRLDAPEPALPAKPKPAKPKLSAKLDVDGYWGKDVTTRTQQVVGTTVDGKVSGQERQHRQPGLTSGWEWNAPGAGKGSQLIHRLQVLLKAKGLYKGKLDGIAGPKFWTAFQLALGTFPDGEIWAKSPAIKQFQRNLNKGKLW